MNRRPRYLYLHLLMLTALLTVVPTACRRMPLYDQHRSTRLELQLRLSLDLQLDLDVDVDVQLDSVITAPDHMKALFFSPADGVLRHTEFTGPTGGDISTPPGTYNMVVYAFGTEYTQIRGENDISQLEAFTSDITATKAATLRSFTRTGEAEPEGPIIYMPDHLLVARETVTIPEWTDEEQTVTLRATAQTIVQAYSFEVHSIVGAEYIEHAEAFVTNQARGSFFGRGELNPSPATLSFPVGVDRRKGCLYTTFNTFGKLPGESRAYLYILIRDTGGQEYQLEEDITDEFLRPDHHIVIDEEVTIPEPPSHGGGIAPSVDPWNEETHDVPLG